MTGKNYAKNWDKAKALQDNQTEKTSYEGFNLSGGTGRLMKPRKKKKRK